MLNVLLLILCSGALILSTCCAEEVRYFSSHSEGVLEMKLSPDGKTLGTVASDGKVVLHDVGDLRKKKIFAHKTRDGAYTTLCFSKKGKHVIVTGGIENLQENLDGIHQFEIESGQREVVRMPLMGSSHHIELMRNGTHLSYSTAGAIRHLNLARGTFSESIPLASSTLHWARDDSSTRYAMAIATEKEVVEDGETYYDSVDPTYLRIVDRSGSEQLRQQLPAQPDVVDWRLHFLTDNWLIAISASGRILQWKPSPQDGKWELVGSAITITPERCSAICPQVGDEMIWLGQEEHLLRVDLKTGEINKRVELTVNENLASWWVPGPITGLVVLESRKMLVASLWDGRIASISFDK